MYIRNTEDAAREKVYKPIVGIYEGSEQAMKNPVVAGFYKGWPSQLNQVLD